MKHGAIMICAVALLCCLNANAQDPFKDLTKGDAVVTFKVPDIQDFVTTYLSTSEDELHGTVANEWNNYLKNGKAGKGVTFTVDKKNGYIRYEMDYDIAYPEDKTGEKSCVEYCYWNCADGLHKLFAENVKLTRNGEPEFAQLTGLYIFVYDNATQKLYRVNQTLLGLGGDVTAGEVTFDLPRFGKDIEMYANGTHKKLVWNGKGFNNK